MSVSEDYGPDFFEMHVPWRCEYLCIAEALIDIMDFDSVLDLGCGNGYIIQRLAQHGLVATGVDGSENTIPFFKSSSRLVFVKADLRQPFVMEDRADLVICTEVAEHLPEQFADVLVKSISDNAEQYVFFSAAEPGYGGHLHVNEQSKQYWIDKFAVHGLKVDEERTYQIKHELQRWLVSLWWFPKNAFVLGREA